MQVKLERSVRGILVEGQLTQDMPTEELEAGEVLTVEGPGDHVYAQPTATVVDAEGLRFFVLLDKLLEALPEDVRDEVRAAANA